nr:MAG TPA: hypothetical protein [Caudoviricetes sp.]
MVVHPFLLYLRPPSRQVTVRGGEALTRLLFIC